jgi:hypothetical protein
MVEDPLIAVLHLHQPMTADVLRKAIVHREAQMDVLTEEVQVLKVALARLVGVTPNGPGLQESARRVGV